jgi:hypothetical protein
MEGYKVNTFKQYQRVKIKIVPEILSERNFDSGFTPNKIPKINQEGIIIDCNGKIHTVERVNKNGITEWICDFREDELILID